MNPPPRSPTPRARSSGGAVIYARVSTDRQAEHGHGLEVQEQACRAWCREQGRRVVAVEVDEGVSGAAGALEQRLALAAALELVRAGRAGELVVYRLDRLARDMVLQEQLLADIVRAGGRLRSTSPVEDAHLVDDPDDPSRQLVRQVLGAVAQHERSMIRLRMKAGKDRKRAAGGYAGGRPPMGYRANRGELELEPGFEDLAERIRRMHRGGMSLRDIGWQLQLDRIPTPSGAIIWHPQQVARILARHRRG